MSSLNYKHIHLLDPSHWPPFHLFKISFTLKNGFKSLCGTTKNSQCSWSKTIPLDLYKKERQGH